MSVHCLQFCFLSSVINSIDRRCYRKKKICTPSKLTIVVSDICLPFCNFKIHLKLEIVAPYWSISCQASCSQTLVVSLLWCFPLRRSFAKEIMNTSLTNSLQCCSMPWCVVLGHGFSRFCSLLVFVLGFSDPIIFLFIFLVLKCYYFLQLFS